MPRKENKSVLHVILSRLLGIALFILIILFLNFLQAFIHESIYYQTVEFLNQNLVYLIIISIVYCIGDVFSALGFPLNLPEPLFNALATYLLADFLLSLLSLLGRITDQPILYSLNPHRNTIQMLAFILVLIIGYVLIFTRLLSSRKTHL